MMNLRKNISLIKNKTVLLRTDFNVPLKNKKVEDDFKIVQSLETIRFLSRYNCRIIIVSHVGKPKGVRNQDLSLLPVAKRLRNLAHQNVDFCSWEDDLSLDTAIAKIKPGGILLLENLRFFSGEEKNGKMFARRLAKMADFYVNDAFAVSHRNHASVSALKSYLPSFSGFLLEREVNNLKKIIKAKTPLLVVMGGAKLTTKMPLIKKIYKKADHILVGGALANNFLLARGCEIGQSLYDPKSLNLAKNKIFKNKLIVPHDVVVRGGKWGKVSVKNALNVSKKDIILDIGPETISLFSSFIVRANTIIWNGPMGYYENKNFREGTMAVANKISARSRGKAFGLAGGGETVAAIRLAKAYDDMDWVSTGGGAMLAFLSGEKMPGLK